MNHYSKLDSSFYLYILIDDRTNLQKYVDNVFKSQPQKLTDGCGGAAENADLLVELRETSSKSSSADSFWFIER